MLSELSDSEEHKVIFSTLVGLFCPQAQEDFKLYFYFSNVLDKP